MADELYAAYGVMDGPNDGDRTATLFVRRYVAPVLAGGREDPILEVGSGTGGTLRALKRLGWCNVVGSDPSPSQVGEARRRGCSLEVSGAVDALRRRTEGSLSGVLALDVLEHLELRELQEFMQLTATRLRPGGVVVLRVPNGGGVFGGSIRYGDLTHQSAFTERSLRQLFAYGGLHPVLFRPCRPLVHGPVSALRWLVWCAFEAVMRVAAAAETGTSAWVLTRNLLAVARRP